MTQVLRVLLAEGVGAGVDATALFEGQPAPFFATLALQQAIEDDDAEDIERARACGGKSPLCLTRKLPSHINSREKVIQLYRL